MAESRTINIDGAGPVLFERSKKARRVNISIKPFGGVRVAVPHRVSFKYAESFARSRLDWIKKHLAENHRLETRGRLEITAEDRQIARSLLTTCIRELAEQHGFSYNRLSFRNQKTRWGSCSADNNISLNVQLIRLPEELRDYVLLHELVHTKIKDHSPRFWQEMERLTKGKARKMSRRLRQYHLGVV